MKQMSLKFFKAAIFFVAVLIFAVQNNSTTLPICTSSNPKINGCQGPDQVPCCILNGVIIMQAFPQ